MTDPIIALTDYLQKLCVEQDTDVLRENVRLMSQMLMELEVEQQTGAGRHECTPERSK